MVIMAVQTVMGIKSGVVMELDDGWKSLGKEWSLKRDPGGGEGVG
jgi:hypothetical protein